jgi:hypothetical protein
MADHHRTPEAQAGIDERHAAARDAATILTDAAVETVHGVGNREDTVLQFGQTHVADQLMRIAPCGCTDDVIAGAVFLIAELSLRLAAAQTDPRNLRA